MSDQLSEHYRDLLEGSYDCVDRIVLNAYFPIGMSPGGFRYWWRLWTGSDEKLDNEHLMRMAGRFSRRLRAYAAAHGIPVVDCGPGVQKHKLAEKQLAATQERKPGLFMILVSKAPALVWEVQKTQRGKIGRLEPKGKQPDGKVRWPFVNHYSFHIWDPEWGHITFKMSGHPPFGVQVMLNGHEYVACAAEQQQIEFTKESNCFTQTADAAGLARVADTLSQEGAIGRLQEVCERWLYSTCLVFALDLEEQKRSRFRYQYSTYQLEYSRNLRFQTERTLEEVFQPLIDRSRSLLNLQRVKTLFGAKNRPSHRRRRKNPTRWGVVVETPTYDVTVFKVHYGKLTLKIYSKGERVLRIEVIANNTKELRGGRSLEQFPKLVLRLRAILERFLNALYCVDACFIGEDLMERLPTPSVVGATRVGGVNIEQVRMRTVVEAIVALSLSPTGFSASELAARVRSLNGQSESEYGPRRAAYDIKKLRGKGLVIKRGRSRSSARGPARADGPACPARKSDPATDCRKPHLGTTAQAPKPDTPRPAV
jgi:DNA-binding transcriptional ArsR family regulator